MGVSSFADTETNIVGEKGSGESFDRERSFLLEGNDDEQKDDDDACRDLESFAVYQSYAFS
ncbi:MAG: hypothetical protein M1835_000090 [Candelina submexicana]|nr:MAG: hypothetical protein M1835_000090 [Candelina submexicana]